MLICVCINVLCFAMRQYLKCMGQGWHGCCAKRGCRAACPCKDKKLTLAIAKHALSFIFMQIAEPLPARC